MKFEDLFSSVNKIKGVGPVISKKLSDTDQRGLVEAVQCFQLRSNHFHRPFEAL